MLRIRLSLLLAGLLALPGGLVGLSAPAQAAACTSTSGVTVVVDFGNGNPVSGCADNSPQTGLEALTQAGFSYAFDKRNQGFVCQINAVPGNPAKCHANPNYWAYFHGQPGGGWTYSQEGAGTYQPQPGSTEGWSFGSANRPPGTKPASPTPSPTPTPSPSASAKATPTTAPSKAAVAAPSVAAVAINQQRDQMRAQQAAARKAAFTALSAEVRQAAVIGAASAVTPAALLGLTDKPTAIALPHKHPPAAAAEPANSGSAVPFIWGLLLLALLGAGATTAAVVRRRG